MYVHCEGCWIDSCVYRGVRGFRGERGQARLSRDFALTSVEGGRDSGRERKKWATWLEKGKRKKMLFFFFFRCLSAVRLLRLSRSLLSFFLPLSKLPLFLDGQTVSPYSSLHFFLSSSLSRIRFSPCTLLCVYTRGSVLFTVPSIEPGLPQAFTGRL